VISRFSDLTTRSAAGELDHWAATPIGRLALTLVFDQFARSVWAGTPRAYAYDGKARDLCLEGLVNGHFDALENVWQKAPFKIPLEHCECAVPADHLANLDIAISIADRLVDEAPPHLRQVSEMGARQPRRHRAVIARFGRHPPQCHPRARQHARGTGLYRHGRFPAHHETRGSVGRSVMPAPNVRGPTSTRCRRMSRRPFRKSLRERMAANPRSGAAMRPM
jgi:uncharacterized protein (DUF924 family)